MPLRGPSESPSESLSKYPVRRRRELSGSPGPPARRRWVARAARRTAASVARGAGDGVWSLGVGWVDQVAVCSRRAFLNVIRNPATSIGQALANARARARAGGRAPRAAGAAGAVDQGWRQRGARALQPDSLTGTQFRTERPAGPRGPPLRI